MPSLADHVFRSRDGHLQVIHNCLEKMNCRIAILVTCFNRKAKTLAALQAVMAQRLPAGCSMEIFLVDDASRDGTTEAVRARFSQVHLLPGTGSLFWNGGMRLAWAEAFKGDFDHYLWLNDDTSLDPDAIARLLNVADELAGRGTCDTIVVGSTRDATTGQHTYGGVIRKSRIHPLKFKLVLPADKPQRCETMNGNCVLVTRATARKAGNLSGCFTHSIGDFDYGLRAAMVGCTIWIAPGFIGTCSRNSGKGTWTDASLSRWQRWRDLTGPKGLPGREYCKFARLHGGPLWPILWILPYLRMVLSCLRSAARIPSPQGHSRAEPRNP